MNPTIDLLLLRPGTVQAHWPLGTIWTCEPTPQALAERLRTLISASNAQGMLCWDPALGSADPRRVAEVFNRPGDLWHAGVVLGMGGLPPLLGTVAPTWMLNCDPDPGIEATSWRLSWRACLMRLSVLRQMGPPSADFLSLAGSALEFGHRCIMRGVFVRQSPQLVAPMAPLSAEQLPWPDQVRFIQYRYGRKWTRWASLRSVLNGWVSPWRAWRAYRTVLAKPSPISVPPFAQGLPGREEDVSQAGVTVLIPTLDRYPYLEVLLTQLRAQTVPPLEIIIVDQTTPSRRNRGLADQFKDLPLKMVYQDQPGQCTSRNAGLQMARGDYVLFIDDDDEVPPDLIESHLRSLHHFQAEVSSGVAAEVGAGALPENFTFVRSSDVFPTNNTLARKSILRRSGLFDLAYNRGQRADGDLGMRVYLTGAVMVLNPAISVLHHHAPAGGLRTHGARVITYASSRKRLFHRQLVSATELYLASRYFSSKQGREMIWLSILGTFSYRGRALARLLKLAISLCCLPHTLWTIRKRQKLANSMIREYPQIPVLASAPAEAVGADRSALGH